ncbi:DUF927 domain-containing protein [Xanthobacter sp. VNH20]|uniref:DUF927 domain-containing protein n=1 Tax=Xanthobacter sp. VNH20 TaxID=3156616 RepID=UPI0032B3C729
MTRAKTPWVRACMLHHNLDDGDWFVCVIFEKVDGSEGRMLLPRSQMDDPRGAKRTLVAQGAKIPTDTDWLENLRHALSAENCPIVESTAVCGWHKGAYILKDRIVGKKGHLHPLVPELRSTLRNGTTKAWRLGFEEPCAESSYLTFVIAAALAGPLLRPMGYDEGVVFHLFGESSTGKSLAAIAAQSVVERAGRDSLRTFDLTARALEEEAAACNDSLLVLDEAGRIEGTTAQRRQHFSDLAFKVAGGQGRQRSAKATADTALRNVRYLVIGLSSGEEPLEARGAAQRKGGEQVRLIGVPVPHPDDGGIFDLQQSAAKRAQLAAMAEQTIANNYGVLLPAFVKAFISDNEGPRRAKEYSEKFVNRQLSQSATFARRFARKFAAPYAAAMLAADYGLAPWTKKQAGNAIRKVYREAWKEVRPAECRADEFLAILQRKANKNRFFPLVEAGEKLDPAALEKAWGVRRSHEGRTQLAMFRRRFAELVPMQDLDVLRVLAARGLVLPGKEQRLYVRQIRIRGLAKPRTDVIMFDLDKIIGAVEEAAAA